MNVYIEHGGKKRSKWRRAVFETYFSNFLHFLNFFFKLLKKILG